MQEILKKNNNIQYSINLEMDYKDNQKLKEYIHTYKSVEIIDEIICSFDENNLKNKSKIMIGPYGKGKSYLALYIMNLLNDKDKSEEKYSNLLDKAKELDINIYNNIKNFINSSDRYLPVVLNSSIYNNQGLNEVFIYSLKKALELNNIYDIELDFYFEKAINKIENWKNNYKDTFEKFKSLIKKDINVFVEELKAYNKKSYNLFVNAYKEIMSGEEFNPYYEINLIDTYIDAVKKIREYGYKGIYVLCDEFSKYIEHIIANNLILDIKQLQDFAELCNRSKGDTKLNLLLISHKSITQYTNNLQNISVDTWKAIEGRFDEIQYNEFSNEQYEIISSAIKKDEILWNKFKVDNYNKFIDLENNLYIRNLFKEISDDEKFKSWILYGAYPLHPIAAYVLPRVSEKVAQNERTLFSFLCKDEENSLINFVNRNDECVKLDAIYDYFEGNILNSGLVDKFVSIIKDTKVLLASLEDEISKFILKTISIVYVVNNFYEIKPDRKLIEELYGRNSLNYIDKLIEENYLIENKSNNILEIATYERTEIFEAIRMTRENNNNENYYLLLNDLINNNFIESREYNDDNSVIRYFKIKFVGNSNKDYIIQDLNTEKNQDGIVYITEEITDIDFGKEVILIENNIPKNIKEVVWDLDAIKSIKNKNNLNLDQDELNILELQYEKRINEYLESVLSLKNRQRVVQNGENIQNLRSKKDLSRLISQSMNIFYPRTVVINNEMINKTNPSIPIVKSRKNIIDLLLGYDGKEIYLKKGSAETTILRSIFINRGIQNSQNKDNYYVFDLNFENIDNRYNRFRELLIELENVVANNEVINVSNLYDICMLKNNNGEYGFGLKRGLIPIIITWVLLKYKNLVSIQSGEEFYELSSETMEAINKEPEKYSIIIIKNSDEKEAYIEGLSKLFMDEKQIKNSKNSNLSCITTSIKYWFLSLNKYTKDVKKVYCGKGEYKKIPKEIVKFKNRIRITNENSIQFLFDDLKEIFDSETYSDLLIKIQECKIQIEGYFEKLCSSVERDIRDIFDLNENDSLNNGMYKWINKFKLNKIIPSKSINNFINTINSNKDKNNILEYLDLLSDTVLGIYLSDWNDNTVEMMISKLKNLKEEIIQLDNQSQEDKEEIKIEEEKEITLSKRAKMLLNDLQDTFEEYGDSIDKEEKKYILIELLKDID